MKKKRRKKNVKQEKRGEMHHKKSMATAHWDNLYFWTPIDAKSTPCKKPKSTKLKYSN